jgi:molybdopterin converting factor small subunit
MSVGPPLPGSVQVNGAWGEEGQTVVEVRLYGKLRRCAEDRSASSESIVQVTVGEGDTIEDVVRKLGIAREELGRNIFLNGQLSALTREVHDGDRLGLFPDDMSLLYRQYFPVHE